ncbi:MAG: hypothetical protein KAV82_04265 [Phycisphaerae bacterium]|nr:hypothetical protein [Phycisphaerae bacterium]
MNDMSLKNAAVKNVLAEAEKHGWERLIASMSDENRVKLIRMLAESNQATHAVLENVVSVYERIIEGLVAMAEQELDVVMGERLERAHRQRSWLGLFAAGGVGYLIGKRA